MSKRLNAQPPKSPFADLVKISQPEIVPGAPLPETAGRMRGKSASPDYIKLTSYIRRETHRAVKKRLLDDGREISELIEHLLGKWLAEHKTA